MMAYDNGFVVAILANGQTLRESGGNVYLPYGTEYTIRLKNKNWRRAVANVSIDGTSIAQGGFVIPMNGSIDIERFVVDGDLSSGRKFKFVDLNSPGVQDPTSDDNGLIVVEFELEKEPEPLVIHSYPFVGYLDSQPRFGSSTGGYVDGTVTYGYGGGGGTMNCCAMNMADDRGATVEGSYSNQQFYSTQVDTDPFTSTRIQLRLRATKQSVKPVLVRDTRYKYCEHCGKKVGRQANYCPTCGKKF